MRRALRFFALFALLVSACTDTDQNTGPGAERPNTDVGTLEGGVCETKSVAEIKTALSLLMAYVVPNDNSTLGKFQSVVDAFNAGNYAEARTRLDNLIGFINLKYGQLSPSEQQEPITELDPDQTVGQYKDVVIGWMNCFIAFDLNPGDPPKVFVTPDGMAGVWFPEDYVPVGTNVIITGLDPNSDPLVTPFDKYPTYVQIQLVPEPTSFNTANGLPVVVVCFPPLPGDVDPNRLLLGAQHIPNDASGFELLEQVNVPQELASQLACSGQLDIAYSGLQKVLRKAADFFLPQKLYASLFAVGGVGGSPEEFSEFGAVDPQLRVGGAGGSPEEFSKAAKISLVAPAAKTAVPPIASVVIPGANSGQVGTESTTGLPSVTVQTEGLDSDGANPIAGVKVTWSLGASNDHDPDGNAHFCGTNPPATVDVLTDANGVAALPCIHWGTIAGFMNLKATVDGSSLGYDDTAGNSLVIIVSDGSIPVSNEVNFLLQATAGAAAAFTLQQSASSSSAAGVAFAQQPTLQLRDANSNPVEQAGVPVTATIATGGGTLAGDLTVETDANGLATFTDLRIDGLTGARTLSFTSAHPAVAGGTVTITAGAAAKLAMVTEPAGARAGLAFTTQPVVEVQDAFGNDVVSNGLTVTAIVGTGAGNLMGTNTANTSGGVATFATLRIDGLVGARTLAFSASGLTGVSSGSFNVTAGNATALVINTQPSAAATAGVVFSQQPVIGLRDAFNNVVTSPEASITASITTPGAGTLMGTLTRSTSGGVATFTDLRIDGLVGGRTLDFSSGALTGVTSTSIAVGPGAASVVQTYMPTSAPVAAATYSFGSGLTEGAAVADAPQVRVTDLWNNPVDGTIVTWSPLSAANGAAAVVGTGGSTSGGGLARITSWTLGAGANQLIAEIAGATAPATFTGSTPTGQVLFACAVGGNKTDAAWMSIPKPSVAGSIREITLYLSITGQSSTEATYPATIEVRKNSTTGTQFGSGSGGVTLPGNNGSPRAITFVLSDPVTTTDLSGTGASATTTIWFRLNFSTLPPTRKIQVWYDNSIKRANQGPCYESRAYAAPSSTTSFVRGLGISVTN